MGLSEWERVSSFFPVEHFSRADAPFSDSLQIESAVSVFTALSLRKGA